MDGPSLDLPLREEEAIRTPVKNKRFLYLECLEERLMPAVYGQPWPDPQQLSLSFVPNGTPVGSVNSNLLDFLGRQASVSGGEAEILRAFQTWAVNSNINIGVVSEQSRVALGAAGDIQGDPRFGDVRIAGRTGLTPDVVATGEPFDWSLGTSAGDVVLISIMNVVINQYGKTGQ